ncbi:MAG: hypothetical protein A2W35_18965 [Chloroflexi bacterium RBG_16_57_11]|nr:MAG: hypothetical protein A2W35_18965 [Chloroflexi bacterium RBG_16_57_11]
MTILDGVHFCDGCGAEITWSPVVVRAKGDNLQHRAGHFCCADCADERPCRCGERMEFDDEFREHGKISIPI